MQTAIQLYTLRTLDEPLAETVDRVGEAGFDGIEFAGLDDSPVGAAVESNGLGVAGAHVSPTELGLDEGTDAVEADPAVARATAARYRGVGAGTLVVPMLDPATFDRGPGDVAAALEDLASNLDARLCYHNHEFEFAARVGDADGPGDDPPAVVAGTRWGDLYAATSDLAFELDVGWAHAAGVDPVAVLEACGDRIPLVHLKDVAVDPNAPRGGRPVELGEGDVPLADCVVAAREAGVEWLVVEHDDPADPLATLGGARATVANLGGGFVE